MTRASLATLLGLAVAAHPAWAAAAVVESRAAATMTVEGTPLDTAMSADGQTIFVLTDRQEVLIYSPDGALRGRLPLSEPAEAIAATPRGEGVLVTSRGKKTVRLLLVDVIVEFSADGAPSKGPADAPVTLVVFSDYQ